MKLDTFKVVFSSHKIAPAPIREKFSLNKEQSYAYIQRVKEYTDIAELLILSTCNRTEIFYASDKDYSVTLIKLLLVQKNLGYDEYATYFESLTDSTLSTQRLYNVSAGLESQVLGDLQIVNQVKHAYQISADMQMAGPFLHRLMHTIFFTNKRIAQETSFRDGAASVSYAAVELAETLTEHLEQPSLLVIGLGEIGRDVCSNLIDKGFTNITVANRTHSRAESLAESNTVKVIPFENVLDHIANHDVVISSISREEPLITKSFLENIKITSHKYFIDLSLPRSIETNAEDIPGVIVYNIDHIREKTSEALEQRKKAIPHVQRILQESIEEFNDWSKEMAFSPTINKLKNALEAIRSEEIARYTKQLETEEAKMLDTITKNIMQKIIKLPVLQLKAACKRGEAETLIDVLNDLFNLEKEEQKQSH